MSKKRFVGCIYLKDEQAIKHFSDETVIDTDPVHLAKKYSDNGVDEIIVYDIDANHSVERFKIGDGTTLVNDLPFTIDKSIKDFFTSKDEIFYIDGGRISDY